MALITNNGELLNVGAKPMAEKEKDRYNRMVDRQRKQFEDNPVRVCRNVFDSMKSNVFNINHTRLSDDDLKVDSLEMNDDKEFIMSISKANRTLDTLSDDDKKRMIGSELLSFAGADENDGTLYIKFKLACMVANNMEN